jgi:TP901 family phage tail tape measure protein
MIKVGHLEASLGLNLTRFNQGLATASQRMKQAGAKMTSVGKSMTAGLTVPIAGAGIAAVKMAADFEKSLSKTIGLVGLSTQEVAGFRNEILSLGPAVGKGPKELADALFFVTSAGLRGETAMEALTMSAKASAAGLGETQVVADLVTSAVNAYGEEALSASKATDILVAAVREGKAEAPALAGSLGQVLPIASQMGITFDQVGASVAAMTRTGTSAETAAMQLKNILASILKPAQQAEDALGDMGTSSAELRKQLKEEGLVSVLGFLAEQMKTNEQAMANVFPNIRALSGALDLMGANAAENVQIFDRMKDTTGMLDQAFNAASQTTSFKFNQALSELKVLAIEVGSMLLPMVNKLLKWIKGAVGWFSSMSSTAKAVTLTIIGLTAAIGPAIAAIGALTTAFAFLTGPIGLVIAGVAALAAAFVYLWDNWAAVKERIMDIDWWRNTLIQMVQYLIEYNPVSLLIKGINELLTYLGQEPIPNIFEELADGLEVLKTETKDYKNEFGSFGKAIRNAGKELGKLVGMSFGGGGGGPSMPAVQSPAPKGKSIHDIMMAGLPKPEAGPMFGPTKNILPLDNIEKAINYMEKLGEAIKDSALDLIDFGSIFDAVGHGIMGNTEAMKNTFAQAALNILGSIQQIINQLLRQAIATQIAKGASKGLAGLVMAGVGVGIVKAMFSKHVQGMRSGGFVTEGGMFQLHKDEMVSLPAGSAVTSQRNSRAAMSGGGTLTTKINMREFVIQLDRTRQQLGR